MNHRALLACSFLAILAEPAQIVRSSSFCDFLGSCCGFFAVFFWAVEGRAIETAVAVLWRCLEVVAMSIPVAHATRHPCG